MAPRQPCAIVAFGGWVDAGACGTGAVRYLANALAGRKYAEIEPEEFYSFTDTRPLASIVGPGQRAMTYPRGEFFVSALPGEAERDVLLFSAPEPNLRWRSFAAAMLDVIQRAGATSIIGVGSIFGAVHHRAEISLTGFATEPRLREALVRNKVQFTNYEGPTGFITALTAEAEQRGVPAAAVIGFTPNYIQGVPNPRVSHGILKAIAQVADLPLPLADLERAGRALMRQVDRLLADQPELREQVDRMLSLISMTEPPPAIPDDADEPAGEAMRDVELPNPQALVQDLEAFLKQLRERGGPNDPPGR